jgi:recombination protein RecA
MPVKKKTEEQEPLVDQVKKSAKKETKEEEKIMFLPSACTIMDCIGGGGFPSGRIVNIVGDKSTGKTLLTMEALFRMHAKFGDKLKIYYDDTESGFTFDQMKVYEKKIFDDEIDPSETVEDFQDNLDDELNKLEEGEYLVYVVDSLDGLTCEAELKKVKKEKPARKAGKDEKGDYGGAKPKKMSQIFRTLKKKIKNKNCLLIIISQVRDKMDAGMFEKKQYRTGGKALDFYASQVFWLYQGKKIIKKEIEVGTITKIVNDKNKVGLPHRKGYTIIKYNYGVDNVLSNIRYLYGLWTPKGEPRSSKIKWEGKEYTPKSLMKYI